MEYFNQQEEVLDIQLTQYGKFLLSKGQFSPTYYAFYDDDIVYDSNYIGFAEEQNRTVARITGSTPRLKTQYNFKGVETEYNKMWGIERGDRTAIDEPASGGGQGQDPGSILETVRTDAARATIDTTIKPYSEKEFSLYEPLGRADPSSPYKPAWQVDIIEGSASAPAVGLPPMTPIYTIRSGRKGDTYKKQIPQINLKMTYETSVKKSDLNKPRQLQVGQISDWDNRGKYIHLDKENMLINVLEENVLFKNKNFDIEVFEIEEQPIPGSNPERHDEILIPLKFMKQGSENIEVTPSYVEYYFDLFVDDEVIAEPPTRTSRNYMIADNSIEDCD